MHRGLIGVSAVESRRLLVLMGLGAAAIAGNIMPVPMGSGLLMLLGSSLVFAAMRFVSPRWGMALACAAASPLWWFWHDPIQCAVWMVHAVLIARARANGFIVITVAYFLTGGVVLNLLGHTLSSGSAIDIGGANWARSAFNCILDVTIGELIHLVLTRSGRLIQHETRTPGVEAVLITVITAALLVPTSAFWIVQLPQVKRYGIDYAQDRGRAAHLKAVEQIDGWIGTNAALLQARALVLMTGDRDDVGVGLPSTTTMRAVTVVDGAGLVRASTQRSGSGHWPAAAHAASAMPDGSVRLANIARQPGAPPVLHLVAPIRIRAERLAAVGELDTNALHESIRIPVQFAGRMIVEPETGLRFGDLDRDASGLLSVSLQRMSKRKDGIEMRLIAEKPGGTLLPQVRHLTLVFGSPVGALRGWSVVTAEHIPWNEAATRSMLARIMVAGVLALMVGIGAAALLARHVSVVLRKQTMMVANLAASGESPASIRLWMAREHSVIATSRAELDRMPTGSVMDLALRHKVINTVLKRINHVAYSALYYSDDRFEIEYTTENIERIVGYSSEEVTSEDWAHRNVHPDDWDARSRYDLRRTDLQGPREYRVRHKNGHYVWIERICVHTEFVPELDAHRLIGIFAEISDRKLTQEESFRADKLASLGRMASGIAHELNQPLNFISVAAMNLREGLKGGVYSASQADTKLTALLRQVERAGSIIRHMRTLGQSDPLAKEQFVLRAVVDRALALAGGQIALENIVIDTSRCGRHVIGFGNPALLEQVVLNVLLNSRDAVLARFQINPNLPGRIVVRACRDADQAVLAIEDNGTGIPEDLRLKLFEPFFTTKAPDRGMGLGLSIAFEIVQSMGGDIRGYDTGNGACFEIRLPAA